MSYLIYFLILKAIIAHVEGWDEQYQIKTKEEAHQAETNKEGNN